MTLPEVSHQHHEKLIPHVDRLLAIAEQIGTIPIEQLGEQLDREHDFIVGTLLPHIEAVECALYPELQRLFQNPRAMSPMEREHREIRRLVGELGTLRRRLHDQGLGHGDTLALRRVLIRLFATLKIHLAEEEEYAPILQHNLTPEHAQELAAAMEHAVSEEF
jgi:hypothetical protein